jgi:copper chaperone NosL
MKKIVFLLIFISSLSSCTIKEKKIDYSVDDCTRCKMKLMDQRYGCEIVTSKGKVFTFDAIECMIPYLKRDEFKNNKPAFTIVTPYTNPGTLINAHSAYYLQSAKLPSPMGAYLTAFTDEKTAIDFQTKNGGKVYSWNELFGNFKEIRSLEVVEND